MPQKLIYMKKVFRFGWGIIFFTSIITSCNRELPGNENRLPEEVIARVGGPLEKRMLQNFHRLETGRYIPDTLYEVPSRHYHEEVWPGDLPGRLILGQTLLQKVSGREAKYLEQIVEDLPRHFNSQGYMGKIYEGVLSEQQLSGHGWLLRGLSEYYLLTGDPVVRRYLEIIVQNLVLPTKGFHKNYPIKPALREDAGGYMGTQEKVLDGWLLSSDVGCDFIFMDGVIQAYSILKTPELKAICYEMAGRFLEADLYKIKAQTHATLTALRGLVRLYGITGDQGLLKGVIERYDLYKAAGMTENYENYNWFQRPEWTEPCAVVDSYQLALDLWKHTGEIKYLEDAQLIWYNAISFEQRDNGGFGLSNCVGPSDHFLEVHAYEAHWCCTMRGAEGIAERVQSLFFRRGDTVFIVDMQPSEAEIEMPGGSMAVQVETGYPFGQKVDLSIRESHLTDEAVIKLFIPRWMENIRLAKGGKKMDVVMDNDFLVIRGEFQAGDHYEIAFSQHPQKVKPVGSNTPPGLFKIQYGPLVLGVDDRPEAVKLPGKLSIEKTGVREFNVMDSNLTLHPVYHLMDEKVNPGNGYRIQLLFEP